MFSLSSSIPSILRRGLKASSTSLQILATLTRSPIAAWYRSWISVDVMRRGSICVIPVKRSLATRVETKAMICVRVRVYACVRVRGCDLNIEDGGIRTITRYTRFCLMEGSSFHRSKTWLLPPNPPPQLSSLPAFSRLSLPWNFT